MNVDSILEQKIYDRNVINEIKKWIDDREMLLLLGARQSGKTSILYKLIQYIISTGKAKKENIAYFDAEIINEAALLSKGPEEIIKFLRPGKGAKKYLFLDEIHYVRDMDRTLKVLVDHYGRSIKVIATGSSSLEIKGRFRESMAGRKIIFNIYPLSFFEFLSFSERDDLLAVIADVSGLNNRIDAAEEHMRQFAKEYETYMMFGGYPRVVLEKEPVKKKKLLEEIYTAYLRKDVSSFFRIDNMDGFNDFIRYAALNSGQLFNKNGAAKELGAASKTIARYVDILKQTYIADTVRPYHTNKTKEILKMPKIYFVDNGIRNSIIGNFASPENRTDAGAVIETAAYAGLLKYAERAENIKFWRAKTGGEVDFVIDGEKLLAFECKKFSAAFSEARYAEFISKYKPARFYVLNLDREENGEISYKPLFFI